MPPTRSTQMLGAIADIYRAENRPEARRTADCLLSPSAAGSLQHHPACALDAQIRDAMAGSPHRAAAAILAAQDHIPWGTNPVADRMSDAAAAICAVATLLSPEGPIVVPDLRLGLFYQRPDSYYALHSHDADETYVILAGHPVWTAGSDTRQRHPGDYIHHQSLLPHAFRTGPEGLLALWRWSGDVNTESYAFLDDPAARGG